MPLVKVPSKRSPYHVPGVNNAGFTIGAEGSNAITVNIQLKDGTADAAARAQIEAYLAGDANGDTLVTYGPNGGVAGGTDGILQEGPPPPTVCLVKGALAIHTTAEQFRTTTTAVYRIKNSQYTKAATAALTFTAGHIITASKFGVILIQVNAAGTISTKVPGATQAYDSAALALAALPAPDAGNAVIGYIAIANNTGDWTANTDDLTDGSDVTTATFVDIEEPSAKQFTLVSEADGDIDVVITHVGAKSLYLALVLPDGTLKVSDVITFAA